MVKCAWVAQKPKSLNIISRLSVYTTIFKCLQLARGGIRIALNEKRSWKNGIKKPVTSFLFRFVKIDNTEAERSDKQQERRTTFSQNRLFTLLLQIPLICVFLVERKNLQQISCQPELSLKMINGLRTKATNSEACNNRFWSVYFSIKFFSIAWRIKGTFHEWSRALL